MTSFPYQRPLTLRLWKIKVHSRVQITPQKKLCQRLQPRIHKNFASLPPLPPTPPGTESSQRLEMGRVAVEF